MNISFNSVRELYDRVYPALKSKVKELKRKNITYIKEVDVWNCLIESKWKKMSGLVLSDIVNDILNTDSSVIEHFVQKEMEKSKRNINLDVKI